MGSALIRVVLDTNIVVSALLFNGQLAWLRRAWQCRKLQPLVCHATLSEFSRVLAYPKFKLSEAERQTLEAEFLPYTELVCLPNPWPPTPPCRDSADRVFLVLAQAGQAEALISGDADLLALKTHSHLPIWRAEELALKVL